MEKMKIYNHCFEKALTLDELDIIMQFNIYYTNIWGGKCLL
jgi:hypothetical protein